MPVKKVKKVRKRKRKRRSSKRRGVLVEDLPKQARMLKRRLIVSTEAGEFLDGCRQRQGLSLSGFIRREHKRVFGTKGVGKYRLPLAKIRVSYQLVYNEYERQDVLDQMPKRFRENCTAVLTGDWSKMNKDTQALYRRAIDVERDVAESMNGRGGVMVKKKKKGKKAKAGRGASARGAVLELLLKNNAVKLTDASMAAKVQKAFPSHKGINTSYISALRKQLNAGIEKKFGKPKAAIKKYEGKKAVKPKAKKAAASKKGKPKKKAARKAVKKVKKVKKVAKKKRKS